MSDLPFRCPTPSRHNSASLYIEDDPEHDCYCIRCNDCIMGVSGYAVWDRANADRNAINEEAKKTTNKQFPPT